MRLSVLSAVVLAGLLGSANAASAQEFSVGSLRISNLWTVATSDSAKDAPAYLTVTNTGSRPDRLVGGHSANSHRIVPIAGKKPEGIVINPGETVTLQPNGNFLKLADLRSGLRAGEIEQAVIQFEQAGATTVEFAIRGGAPKGKSAAKRPQPQAN